MKFLIVSFLCTLAAVQGRSAYGEQAAVLGENPYLVHIRIAISNNGGRLVTCAGSLIGSSWVLTRAACLRNSRFIWLRFGAVDVSRPELVVEGNLAASIRGDLALLNVTREIGETNNIRHVALADAEAELPSTGKFCAFGSESNGPGNQLTCAQVSLEASEAGILAVSHGTRFDFGAPLVSEGVQVGVLLAIGESSVFESIANNREWIKNVTGL